MIIVLGFDGLGLPLVEEFNLMAVRLSAYTETDLSEFRTHPFTPIIWASMITGRIIREMEDTYISLQNGPLLHRVARKILPYKARAVLGKLYDRFTGKEPPIANAMNVLMGYLQERGIETIFEELDRKGVSYWHNYIPGYNGVPHHDENMEVIKRALAGEKSAYQEYKRLVWRQHHERVKEFMEVLEEGREFYFFYTNLIDALGHLFYGSKRERRRMAWAAEDLALTVSKLDAKVFIISDHGMALYDGIPDHSHNGFFSSNTGELIEKPHELYGLLRRHLL